MQNNVGKIDQTVRYVIAVILIVLAIILEIWWLLIPAIILGFTAAVSWCGLYKLFGINTCKFDKKE